MMIGFLHIDEDPESNPLLLNHPETQKKPTQTYRCNMTLHIFEK